MASPLSGSAPTAPDGSADPKFDASQQVPDFAYDDYAEDLGLKGLRMEAPEDVGRV